MWPFSKKPKVSVSVPGYTISHSYSDDTLLSEWRWLTGPQARLLMVSVMGDAFLEVDHAVHHMSAMTAELTKVAASLAEFQEKLRIPANASDWLLCDVVDGQKLLGMTPGANECISTIKPILLGGEIDPDNFEIEDVRVHFSILGQIAWQCKTLPPGTPVVLNLIRT